jgi:hypothetical protein
MEMQIKTTLRFHLTPIIMTIIKKAKAIINEDVGIKKPLNPIGGNVN